MIVGSEKPDGGKLLVGETVKLAYVDQSRDALQGDRTVEEISGGAEHFEMGKRRCRRAPTAASSASKGTDQQKRIKELSGGERNRVHLAKMLSAGGNLLLLDEPTNDLDVDTLRALEEALNNFAGCAVIISHDRWFLDRLATHILAFEGDRRRCGSRATAATTKRIASGAWARTPISRTASATRSSPNPALRPPLLLGVEGSPHGRDVLRPAAAAAA